MDKNDYYIEVNLKGNILKYDFFWRKSYNNVKMEYACYLYKNNKRIAINWYTFSDCGEFFLNETGSYHVIGFVKIGNQIMQKISSNVDFIAKSYINNNHRIDLSSKSISIFGSCVSRDVLEFYKNDDLTLKNYIARQSIISAISKPITVEEQDVKLTSNFQKKQILNDLRKTTFDILLNNKSDYLIIDLIDERFRVGKYEDSYFTISQDFVNSGILKSDYDIVNVAIRKRKYYFDGRELDFYVNEFCDRVCSIYNDDKIILHKALFVDRYINKLNKVKKFPLDRIRINKIVNKKINYIFKILKLRFPNALVIDITPKYYASENHRWGLAQMHYQDEYYDEAQKIINLYINKPNSQ